MSTKSKDTADEQRFSVTRIEKTGPPDADSKGTWYRYVIGHGASAIRGLRSGSKQSVKEYAEEFAENLNQRALSGYSAYAARKQQKK